MGKIKLSIVVPVWNQQDLIVRALASIPHREDVEIIVVNDGSTDNTSTEIWDNLDKFNKNIRMVEFEDNRGVAEALNAGLELINGEYYIALGSDDYFLTDELNEFIDKWLTGEYDMVYYNLRINDGSLITLNEENRGLWVGSTKAYKRTIIGNTRYPDKKRAHEDAVFDVLIRRKEHTHVFTNMTIKHYNFPRENSLTWQVNHGEIKDEDLGKLS